MKNSYQSIVRGLTLAGLFLTGAIGGYAQTTKPAATQKRCLMWKAVNGNNVVYLLGSIHLGSKDMYPLPKMVEDAYTRSKVLVVEVDIDKVNQGEMAAEVMSKGLYTDGDTLWKHIKPETADKVKAFCKKYGALEAEIAMSKPWLASVELSIAPLTKAGMDPNKGIDKYFLDRADSPKTPKRVEQVESASFQFNLLSSLPENLSDEWLLYTIGQGDTATADDTKIAKLWTRGDANELAKVMLEVPKPLAKVQRAILEDRNPHMTDVAEKYLKGNGPCFFVVGAGHLVGPEGVVALLQKRGYSVTQISAAESAVK